jgi:hypothetical protein
MFDIYIRVLRNSILKSASIEDITALMDMVKLIENIKDDII